jgi:hypothetical protein
MSAFTSFIFSEQGIVILGAIGAAIWVRFKRSEFYACKLAANWADALEAISAGVAKCYLDYVRPTKAINGGTLTTAQARLALDKAGEFAQTAGANMGVDVVATVGREFLDAYIQREVAAQKTKSGGGNVTS